MMRFQDGGRFLGEGVYGCAFEPALKCNKVFVKNKKTRTVGKLTKIREGQTEFEVSQKLKDIPNADKYFTIIQQLCTPLPRYKQEDPELNKCEILKKANIDTMVQLVMPFSGKPLYSVPKSPSSIHFYKMGRHILEAGALLLTRKIVHGDLHAANILVSSPDIAKIIDYGLAWSPDKLTLANVDLLARVFYPKILQEPPELTYLQGLLSKMPERIIFSRIQEEKSLLKSIEKVYGVSVKSQMDELKDFVRTSKVVKARDYYGFYKLYWSKIDAWALGYDLLTLYVEMMMVYGEDVSPELEKNKVNVLRAIRGLLEIDPAKRLDAAEALEIWDPNSKVLKTDDVQEWLIKQKPMRYKIDKILH
jgi:serine/threonine protein kinase